MTFKKWFLIGIVLIWAHAVVAQQDTCPTVVQDALAALDSQCSTTERNQACYGNVALTAVPESSAKQFKFDHVGDIANLDDIRTMKLEPLDTAKGTWGLVMMKVQADIPDTMPGQNVTFVLFGDVTIENAAKDGQKPMQAFYLTTGIGDSKCAQAPESGLMVQTPSGVKDVAFNVNGVDVDMGSTVIFQAKRGKVMRVKTVEGKARLKVGRKTIPVVQGSEYIAPINDNLDIKGNGELIPYKPDEVDALPIGSLDRKITISDPLTDTQIEEVKTRAENDQPLCSDDEGSYLPPCSRPVVDANGNAVQMDDKGNVVLKDENGNALFYNDNGDPITSMGDYYRHVHDWTGQTTFTDPDGKTIAIQDDGSFQITDEQGQIFIVAPNGKTVAVDADGTTHPVDNVFGDPVTPDNTSTSPDDSDGSDQTTGGETKSGSKGDHPTQPKGSNTQVNSNDLNNPPPNSNDPNNPTSDPNGQIDPNNPPPDPNGQIDPNSVTPDPNTQVDPPPDSNPPSDPPPDSNPPSDPPPDNGG